MSILIKASAGLIAGMVAGGLGLVFFPRPEASALKPRVAVEKPQFVLASASDKFAVEPTPRATAAVALAEETPQPKKAQPTPQSPPSPVASAPPVLQAKAAPVAVAALDPIKAAPAAPVPTPVSAKPAPSPISRAPVVEATTAVIAATPAPSTSAPETQRAAVADAPAPVKLSSAARKVAAIASDASASWSVRGLVALGKGDLSSARVYLARAADAGDPRALVALADSYDPTILAKLGVVGAPGDPQRAKDYLSKAAAAGVLVAKDRMAALDQDSH